MLVLISSAKTFAKSTNRSKALPPATLPLFLPHTEPVIRQMISLDVETLGKLLHLSPKLSVEAYMRWQDFIDENTHPTSVLALYEGMVFKKIDSKSFSPKEWEYAQQKLLITSFLYGLLRPLDAIHPYRLEGSTKLELGATDKQVFAYWRDILTPYLIERVQAEGGTLIFLASEEMKLLFHWEEVERSVRVVTPTFLVEQAQGSRKQITIYTKMARGVMTGYILRNQISEIEELKGLSPEGFVYHPELSNDREWVYVLRG